MAYITEWNLTFYVIFYIKTFYLAATGKIQVCIVWENKVQDRPCRVPYTQSSEEAGEP